jgi:hypothetical protein
MATVWKFQIEMKDKFEIEMPRDAELLYVATQNETPCLWARVVPERTREARRFRLCGTGHEIDMDCRPVGSFMLQGGAFVFHLFEVK